MFDKNICKASNHTCNICKKKGHFEKCCYSKKYKAKSVKEVGDIQDTSDERDSDDEAHVVKQVNMVQKNKETLKATLVCKINKKWKNITGDLNTGAAACLVGYQYLCNLYDDRKLELRKSKLGGFGGTR